MSVNETMTALADAVRSKSGATGKLSIAKMTEAVNSIQVGGSADYYKCAAVHGPRKVTYINVSGAGSAAVNGDYEKTSFTSGTGGEVWKHRTADYYYYEYDGYLCIHSDYNTFGDSALYYTWDGNEWHPGYDYGNDSPTGASPAPTVSRRTETLDADVPKTWDGYKAVLTDGVYIFSDALTTGLPYGAGFTPVAGTIYDRGCLTKAVLWQGTLFKVDANTLAYINFDDGEPIDLVGHDITKEGGVSTPDGYYSGAWDFQSGYLQILPNGDELVIGTGDFTWEAYIYPASDGRQCLFAYEQDGIFSVCFSYGGGANLGVFWRGDWYDHPISGELSMNVWQHVAFVRKDGIFSCFVNGVKQSQTYDLSSVSVGESGQKFGIGRWGGDPGDFGARWVSRMDEIRISNVARYTDDFIPA